MTYPTAGGGSYGDRFGTKVKVNQDFMGVMTQRTNGFDTYLSYQDNPSLHLYKRQVDNSWALLGPPFYVYPFYDSTGTVSDESLQIKDFAIVKENLFITTCKDEACMLRHFYNDGISWQLVLSGNDNYIYPGVDNMNEVGMFGYGDYFTVGCGTTNIPIRLDCYSMKLWKRDPTTLAFTLHQTITAPGEFDELSSIQDMSPDGQWMVVTPNNDVFQNVGGTWSHHSRIPDLYSITIDNGRLVGADRTTDTLETYVLESGVWTKKPLLSLGAGMDVSTGSHPEFKLSVNKLYFMDKSSSTIKVYEAGVNIWTLVQDISMLGSYQASEFVDGGTSKLWRFSATEFAISAPYFDSNKGTVLFLEDGTAYPTVTPTVTPTATPTATPTETGETPGPTRSPTTAAPTGSPTFPPTLSPVFECDDSGMSPTVVAGAVAGAGLGGALLGAGFTYLVAFRSVVDVATPGARMAYF